MPYKPHPSQPFSAPPDAIIPLLRGLLPSNAILSSEGTRLFNCRRCTLIGCQNIELNRSYNNISIGSLVSETQEEVFEYFGGEEEDTIIPYEEGKDSLFGTLEGVLTNKIYKFSLQFSRNSGDSDPFDFEISYKSLLHGEEEDLILKKTIFSVEDKVDVTDFISSKNGDIRIYMRSNNGKDLNLKSYDIYLGNETASKKSSVAMFFVNSIKSRGDVAYSSLSDERLKDNIKPLENCLEKILSLDAIGFEWNDKQNTYSGKDIGLIAQQVESIAPEIVKKDHNGYKKIKYEKTIPLALGSIQENNNRIKKIIKYVKFKEK
jgi:hypothetical protein